MYSHASNARQTGPNQSPRKGMIVPKCMLSTTKKIFQSVPRYPPSLRPLTVRYAEWGNFFPFIIVLFCSMHQCSVQNNLNESLECFVEPRKISTTAYSKLWRDATANRDQERDLLLKLKFGVDYGRLIRIRLISGRLPANRVGGSGCVSELNQSS